MDKTRLFEHLTKQNFSDVLELLQSAYDKMNTQQRQSVFDGIFDLIPPPAISAEKLLKEIRKFHSESMAGKYYAPFNINSKNLWAFRKKQKH